MAAQMNDMNTAQKPEGRSDIVVLVSTILIASFNNASLVAARLIMPLIGLGMGLSSTYVGLMAALFTLTPMLFNVRFGRWVDRVGTLLPIYFSNLLIVLAGVLFAVFSSPAILFPVAGLIGAGAVFSHVAATRAVGEIGHPSKRAANLGYLVLGYSALQFVMPMIASISFERFGAVAALAAIGCFAILGILWIFCGRHNFSSRAKRVQPETSRGRTVELLRLPDLRRWLLIAGTFSTSFAIYPFIVSLHAVEVGLSPAQAGLMFGAFAVGSAISRGSVSLVTRYSSPNVTMLATLVIGGITYAVLPFAHDFYPLMALSLIIGATLAISIPISLALIYDDAPEGRVNEAIGLSMSITNFMQTVTPLALGILASHFGVAVMIWALAIFMLAASVLTAKAPGR